ncbi:hypothetical protein CMV_024633 [Castanea mollissima]|uniref:Uncharacterized protein n=1 Tax=Castanea mollissima TaxID=60419 RepID=A0A8J4QMU0_9ROSI|nr:hypothetical protein CMV_024633 [Castanea mollissima]
MAPSTCTLPWPSDPLTSTSPSLTSILNTNGVDSSRSNVCRREYTIGCNWKELQLTVLLWEFPKHSFLQLLIW